VTAARSAIGKIDCPHCGRSSEVCKNKSDVLYYRCRSCGIANLHGPDFQEWILKNATIYDRETPKPNGETRAAPVPAPKEKEKARLYERRSNLDDGALEDGDFSDPDDEFDREFS
jgi:predicted RNA-binding Zn-ribbon protein involved in translation (DUF1610 family)